MAVDGSVCIKVTVRNQGCRSGCEVVQLYVRDPIACVTRPALELKGFERIVLAPGAAASVTFTLHADVLAFTGTDPNQRIVEPGSITLSLGASSTDLRFSASVAMTGALRRVQKQAHFLAVAESKIHHPAQL